MTDAENRELAGYFGICWHIVIVEDDSDNVRCSCGDSGSFNDCMWHCRAKNPDFSDPVVVLREMRKLPEKEYARFLNSGVGCYEFAERAAGIPNATDLIESYLMVDETGLLARAALKWLRREKHPILEIHDNGGVKPKGVLKEPCKPHD